MNTITPILETFRYNHFIMGLLTDDLSEKHAVWRMRGQTGSSVTWTVGHLCRLREETIHLLNGPQSKRFKKPISDALDADGSKEHDFQALMDVWNELHDGVERVLPDATEDILQTVIKKPMAPPHVKTVLDALIFYGWHEAYHMGTMAMIRATLNYPETSTRIMESFRK